MKPSGRSRETISAHRWSCCQTPKLLCLQDIVTYVLKSSSPSQFTTFKFSSLAVCLILTNESSFPFFVTKKGKVLIFNHYMLTWSCSHDFSILIPTGSVAADVERKIWGPTRCAYRLRISTDELQVREAKEQQRKYGPEGDLIFLRLSRTEPLELAILDVQSFPLDRFLELIDKFFVSLQWSICTRPPWTHAVCNASAVKIGQWYKIRGC